MTDSDESGYIDHYNRKEGEIFLVDSPAQAPSVFGDFGDWNGDLGEWFEEDASGVADELANKPQNVIKALSSEGFGVEVAENAKKKFFVAFYRLCVLWGDHFEFPRTEKVGLFRDDFYSNKERLTKVLEAAYEEYGSDEFDPELIAHIQKAEEGERKMLALLSSVA